MKICITSLSMFLLITWAYGKQKNFTGSTPAGDIVKLFLGIPLKDSIDFIRWKLLLDENNYSLQCNYGLSKPNTNGFIDGGEQVALNGAVKKEKNYYRLQNGDKVLNIAELNASLLHLLDANNIPLTGNGGWSYSLNSLSPVLTDQINLTAKQTAVKDSMTFEGRTPCGVPGIIPAGNLCYKLKWYIILYANTAKNGPGTYRVFGTTWRKEGGRTGNWKIITGKDGRIIYQLNDENGNGLLYLLKPDEHILLFTDAQGKILVGDEDFSYTLNRIL